MEQAINAYYNITASDQFKEIERMREKARHDEAQALHHARNKGLEEGFAKGSFNTMVESIRNIMNGLNLPLDQTMALLKVPESDRQKYKEALAQ